MSLCSDQTGLLLLICLTIASRIPGLSSVHLNDRCLKSSDCSDSGAVCRDIQTKAILSDALSSPLTQSFDPSTVNDYIAQGLADPFQELELSDPTANVTTSKGTDESNLILGDDIAYKDTICTITKVWPSKRGPRITTPTSVITDTTTSSAGIPIDINNTELNDQESVTLNDVGPGLLDDTQEPLCIGQMITTDKMECRIAGTLKQKQKQLLPCSAINSVTVTKSPAPESMITTPASTLGKAGTCQCDKKLRFPCSNDSQCRQRFPNRPNMWCSTSQGCPSRIANGYCRQENKVLEDAL